MSKLCCTYMLGMFVEGMAEVREMQGYLRAKVDGKPSPYDAFYSRGFTETIFETQLHHAYHHLNYVWGCRHATHKRATRCAGHDFHIWEKFPRAFRELIPNAPRKAVRTRPETVLYFESILPELEEALRVGDEIYVGLCAHFTEKTCPRQWDPRAANVEPLTEARLKALMCQLLGALNFAWNVRRLPIERVRSLSPKAKQHRHQYPAEFAYYLTARHFAVPSARNIGKVKAK